MCSLIESVAQRQRPASPMGIIDLRSLNHCSLLDTLAQHAPELFDRYLYVGTTRAATYLSVHCETELPAILEPLEAQFGSDWRDVS